MNTPVNAFLLVFFFILGMLLYHAIFDVWYFNFTKALTGELIGALIFSIVLTAVAIKWWFIPAIILIAIGIGLGFGKCHTPLTRGIVIGAFCIGAIIVAVNGIIGNKALKEQEQEKEQQVQTAPDDNNLTNISEPDKTYTGDVYTTNTDNDDNLPQKNAEYSIQYGEMYLTQNQDGAFVVECHENGESELFVDIKWLDPYQVKFLPVSLENASDYYLKSSAENPDLYQNESGSLIMRLLSDSSFEITERENRVSEDQVVFKNSSGVYHVSSNDEIALLKNETILSNAGSDEGDEYILPEADTRYYNAEELKGLDFDTLRLARNEILARHGRIFESEDLNSYFSSKGWYQPRYTADEFDPQMDQILNAYEKANIEEIKKIENGEGNACLYQVTVNAPDGYVNLRDGAGTNYNVVKKITNGVVLNVYEESTDGSWLQTEYQGDSGWVAASQVQK